MLWILELREKLHLLRGANGIDQSITKEFAKHGVDVILTSRDQASITRMHQELECFNV